VQTFAAAEDLPAKTNQSVEAMISDHIDHDPDLRSKSERLQQVTGVGPILSATLLAYVPELGKIESAQLSALIGVAPYPKDSGRCTHPVTSEEVGRRYATFYTWQPSPLLVPIRSSRPFINACSPTANPLKSVSSPSCAKWSV